jgi:GT2 family glycosyltransferase
MPSLWSMTCFATGLSTMFRRSSLVNPEELPGLDRAKPTVVPVASGCVLLINRARFEELGGFTPDYFMYSEDVDICHRHGAGVAYVPEAKVLHVNGASSGTTARKLVMLLRGKTTFVRLHWSPGRAALGRWLLTTGVGARAFGSLLTGRAPMWREMWRNRAVWLAGWPPVATDR